MEVAAILEVAGPFLPPGGTWKPSPSMITEDSMLGRAWRAMTAWGPISIVIRMEALPSPDGRQCRAWCG
jgi:hypothetical protein